MSRQQIRESESYWATPVAIATFFAVVLMIGAAFVSSVSGTGDAEILRSVDAHRGSVTVSGLMQALGFALLTAPLVYLFRAVRARSERVRSQLIGLVIVAPLFLALSTGLSIGARHEAASQFVQGEAKSTLSRSEAHEKCTTEQKEDGRKDFAEEFEPKQGETPLAACEREKGEDDEASNALGEASLAPFVSGFGIAGGLGLAIVLFYCCLWAMRTGLLTRFWGSLGMALGVAALLGLILFTLIWFVYFALMILGVARPPAWEAGEAIPWPSPGEKAAAELEPREAEDSDEGEGDDPGEKRKRKRRESFLDDEP